MRYTQLVTRFGGMNTATSPYKLPVGVASDVINCDLSGGAIRPRHADSHLGNDDAKSLHDWNGTLVVDVTEKYHFCEWGGRLLRCNYRPDATKAGVQYTTTTKYASGYWDLLGIKAPAAAPTTALIAGALTGTYEYYQTFINAEGDESPPSPVSASVSPAGQGVRVTLQQGYGQGTTTNGSDTVTGVVNIGSFRKGMRITSTAGIPAGTYVTAVNTGASTLTLSQAATASGARELQDAQVTQFALYRIGGTVARKLHVATVAAGTATYDDNIADTSLGVTLKTDGYDVLPVVGGFDIAPNGVIVGIVQGGTAGSGTTLRITEIPSSTQLFGLTKAAYVQTLSEEAGRAFYGLDRFCIFARSGVYSLIGSDVSNFEVVRADGRLPSLFYWPVNMGPEVWYLSAAGVCAFDGVGIRSITESVFAVEFNQAFGPDCIGAVRRGARFIASTGAQVIEFDPRIAGSPWITHTYPAFAVGETAQCLAYDGTNDVVLVGTTANYWRFAWENGERVKDWSYTTGYLPAGKHAPLKKFRATLVAGIGPWTTTMQIGTEHQTNYSAADAYAGSSPAGSYIRRKTWLASGYKGRGIKFAITGPGGAATVSGAEVPVIDEIGVYVGEEREVAA